MRYDWNRIHSELEFDLENACNSIGRGIALGCRFMAASMRKPPLPKASRMPGAIPKIDCVYSASLNAMSSDTWVWCWRGENTREALARTDEGLLRPDRIPSRSGV